MRTEPTEFAPAPFASGVPTVIWLEVWVGGLQDPSGFDAAREVRRPVHPVGARALVVGRHQRRAHRGGAGRARVAGVLRRQVGHHDPHHVVLDRACVVLVLRVQPEHLAGLQRIPLEAELTSGRPGLRLGAGQQVGIDPAPAHRVEVAAVLVASRNRPRAAVVGLRTAHRRTGQVGRWRIRRRGRAEVVSRGVADDLGTQRDPVPLRRAVVCARAGAGDVHVVHVAVHPDQAAVDRRRPVGSGGSEVRVRVADRRGILRVTTAVDVQPQRHGGLGWDGESRPRHRPVLVDDLDAEVLRDRGLVDEVVDQPEVRVGPVVVAVRRRQVHLAALVAGGEEALAQLTLEAARAHGVRPSTR